MANEPGVTRSSGFDEWVTPHLTTLRRYAVMLDATRDPDDLVQDTLERAWKKWWTYSPDRGSARTWLIAIAADRARRRRVRSPRLHLVELEAVPTPVESDSTDWSGQLDVRNAIARLPRRQKQAVLLFYYVDLNVRDVAEIMGCAPGTVKSTMSDARLKLAELLGDQS